ncbi:MAG: hypothetical protein EBT96_01280 [Betaproteobacteria bacterium]|nr:hypothetical protein [Betaproteobacteria bacterium]
MKIGFLTQHGKEALLAQILAEGLGAELSRVEGFDTDTLGTFTRECPRRGTQVEAATRKAELALELSAAQVEWGLGSEGAFHLDPYLSLLPWNTEVLVLIERRSGYRITALAHAKAQSVGVDVRDWDELRAAAERAGFPEHHLVLRRSGADGPVLAKGLACLEGLRKVFQRSKASEPELTLHVENDLRAHANPTRQTVIRQAGLDLVRRFHCRCPQCHAPGYGLLRAEPGAPCASCGTPTRVPRAEVWSCPSCGHQAIKPRAQPVVADPQRCDVCNP